MLLHYDGFDKLWTEEDWLTSDPVDSDDEESKENKEHNAKKRFMIRPDRLLEYHLPTGEKDVKQQVESGHFELKHALVVNLKYLWQNNEVEHLPYPKKQ
jgi:hypothetical protein